MLRKYKIKNVKDWYYIEIETDDIHGILDILTVGAEEFIIENSTCDYDT